MKSRSTLFICFIFLSFFTKAFTAECALEVVGVGLLRPHPIKPPREAVKKPVFVGYKLKLLNGHEIDFTNAHLILDALNMINTMANDEGSDFLEQLAQWLKNNSGTGFEEIQNTLPFLTLKGLMIIHEDLGECNQNYLQFIRQALKHAGGPHRMEVRSMVLIEQDWLREHPAKHKKTESL